MNLLSEEEFSQLPIEKAKEYLFKVLNELSDEEAKDVYEYLTKSPEFKPYLEDLD